MWETVTNNCKYDGTEEVASALVQFCLMRTIIGKRKKEKEKENAGHFL